MLENIILVNTWWHKCLYHSIQSFVWNFLDNTGFAIVSTPCLVVCCTVARYNTWLIEKRDILINQPKKKLNLNQLYFSRSWYAVCVTWHRFQMWSLVLAHCTGDSESSWVGQQACLCLWAKENIIWLPPGSMELWAEVEFLYIDHGLSSLNNVLQFLEAMCIVCHCLAGFNFRDDSASGTRR